MKNLIRVLAAMAAMAGFADVESADERQILPKVVIVRGASAERELKVEAMRCSAMPVNIRWPGHQRELDQTEICHFARFDFTGETRVRVSLPKGTRQTVVRPVSRNVKVVPADDFAEFTLKTPGAYSVEFDGRHRNLMLFADPPRDWSSIDRKAANVRWFGAGEHEVGVLRPKAGETLFLDEGAVVYGRIEAVDADGLRICGRGILDCSRVKEVPIEIDPKLAEEQRKKGWAITNVDRFDAIRLSFCDDVRIEGITVRDSQIYAIRPICCDRFTVDNVKIVGSWRYNSDGIDMHNCRHVRIRDSFIRTYDDSICVKGFDYALPETDMLHDGVLHDVFEDVLVERCTIWNDWGRALEIGAETRAREIRDVTFRDCDVLAVQDVALDVQNCDQAHVHDVTFENIRVEYDPDAPDMVLSASAKDFRPGPRRSPALLAGVIIHYIPEYSKAGAANRGRTSSVSFRDIDVIGPQLPSGFCFGFDAEHRVSGVTFSRIRHNGADATAAFAASVATNGFASIQYRPWSDADAAQDLAVRLEAKLPEIFKASAAHYEKLMAASEKEQPKPYVDTNGVTQVGRPRFPRNFDRGVLGMVEDTDWTSGFFPGSLWYLYEATGDEKWRDAAVKWTDRLEGIKDYPHKHDIGFMMYCSAGNALRITRDPKYESWLHSAAKCLRERFSEKTGTIRSWNNWGEPCGFFGMHYVTIIDNMMNLELLMWDSRWWDRIDGAWWSGQVARKHADTTMKHHFRADGSAYHILDYDPETGKVHGIRAGQGACVEGTWARGQAWAVYGFTMMYRETREAKDVNGYEIMLTRTQGKEYLEQAIKAADYVMDAPTPADGIPYWDYKAPDIPNEPRDSSAAAILSSALLELAKYAPAEKASRYRAWAVRALNSLCGEGYFAKPGECADFLLKHGTGVKPFGGEIDTPLNYGDYYFLEALLRFRELRQIDAPMAANAPLRTPWKGRGIEIAGPKSSEVDRFCEFVGSTLAPAGINTIFLSFNYR